MSDFENMTDRDKKYYLAGRLAGSASRKILWELYETAESETEKAILKLMLAGLPETQ